MSDAIERYLGELRGLLAGADPATAQDALADAEDHLRSALSQARTARPGVGDQELLPAILDEYGSPEEIATAYRDLESRFIPSFAPPPPREDKSPLRRFLGVLGDPRAYAALFFMLFSLITGIVYFTWAVTGISLSVGLAVMIFGLPFFGLFVFSVQGLALVEGRLIETLLGIRMPRRAAAAPAGEGIWGKFKARVADRRTWTTLFYLILKLPLGVITFSVFITFLVYGVQLILLPVLQYVFGFPLLVFGDTQVFVPYWFAPILMLAGFLEVVLLLHAAKFLGRAFGGMAKGMLVQG